MDYYVVFSIDGLLLVFSQSRIYFNLLIYFSLHDSLISSSILTPSFEQITASLISWFFILNTSTLLTKPNRVVIVSWIENKPNSPAQRISWTFYVLSLLTHRKEIVLNVLMETLNYDLTRSDLLYECYFLYLSRYAF